MNSSYKVGVIIELRVMTSRCGVPDVPCPLGECTLLCRSGIEVPTSVVVFHKLIKEPAEDP